VTKPEEHPSNLDNLAPLPTRPAGTTITWIANGQPERFELTDVLLHDNTFAAEPLDRYT
jgi:hypothetical protein